METMDKTQRFSKTIPCPNCGEEYSVTYKRCPFCGGSPRRREKKESIDIQGPELHDEFLSPQRPPAEPAPPPLDPAPAEELEEFIMDVNVDFTPELEDETSSVPAPPPGATGGRRLQAKGSRRSAGNSGGGSVVRKLLFVLSLLIVAAAIYILVTKLVPILEARFGEGETDPGTSQGDGDMPNQQIPENPPEFTLTELSVTLTAPGATKQLVPVIGETEGAETLTWQSDNEEVVTVSEEGKLTAVGNGTATITVTKADGTQAQCQVTCAWDDTTVLDNLKLNTVDFTIREGDPSVQMKVLGFEGTPPSIKWESKNPEIATISENGLVERVSPGTTEVTATINGQTVLTCVVRCK